MEMKKKNEKKGVGCKKGGMLCPVHKYLCYITHAMYKCTSHIKKNEHAKNQQQQTKTSKQKNNPHVRSLCLKIILCGDIHVQYITFLNRWNIYDKNKF
jgi:hypothetical protein